MEGQTDLQERRKCKRKELKENVLVRVMGKFPIGKFALEVCSSLIQQSVFKSANHQDVTEIDVAHVQYLNQQILC